MNDSTVLLIANLLVLNVFAAVTSFIVAYAWKSPWQSTPIGSAFMHIGASMWLLVTYALTSRVLEPLPWVQDIMALCIYAIIGVMWWRVFFVLRFIQTGRITLEEPNYTPIRNWLRKLLRKGTKV